MSSDLRNCIACGQPRSTAHRLRKATRCSACAQYYRKHGHDKGDVPLAGQQTLPFPYHTVTVGGGVGSNGEQEVVTVVQQVPECFSPRPVFLAPWGAPAQRLR